MNIEDDITAAISGGLSNFTAIWSRLGNVEFRTVDRGLQRLRKRGLIKFVKGGVGWRMTKGVEA